MHNRAVILIRIIIGIFHLQQWTQAVAEECIILYYIILYYIILYYIILLLYYIIIILLLLLYNEYNIFMLKRPRLFSFNFKNILYFVCSFYYVNGFNIFVVTSTTTGMLFQVQTKFCISFYR